MDDSVPDVAFRALGNSHRRRILLALEEADPGADVSVSDVVDPRDLDEETVELALFHVHLPMLEGPGFVEWDPETHTVREGPNFQEISPLLELLAGHRDELPDCWI